MQLSGKSGAVKFSSALLTSDLNDFLSPSNACVLPLSGGVVPPERPPPPGSVATPIYRSNPATETPAVAKVTLSDCLSCSGCLTSAETILLESQSPGQLEKALSAEPDRPFVVVSLSQQSVASIAALASMGSTFDLVGVAGRVAEALRRIGVDAVLDVAIGRDVALLAQSQEFARRVESGQNLPMISSACPGFVCYAEKTQPDLLPLIAETKSPQAIMGTVAKSLLPVASAWKTKVGGNDRIFHCTVMPCFDKKLEASRAELVVPGGVEPEVDCVLTTSELWEFLRTNGYGDLSTTPWAPLDSIYHGPRQQKWFGSAPASTSAGTSGGFADFILRKAIRRENLNIEQLGFKELRNFDLREATDAVADLTQKPFRFAVANGFRNIQNLSRKIKQGKCHYDYVEIMSCPGGCSNGGGQLGLEGASIAAMRERLAQTDAKYAEASEVDENESKFLLSWLEGRDGNLLGTSYRRVEKSTTVVPDW